MIGAQNGGIGGGIDRAGRGRRAAPTSDGDRDGVAAELQEWGSRGEWEGDRRLGLFHPIFPSRWLQLMLSGFVYPPETENCDRIYLVTPRFL
jgi:hypothetical protein